MADALCRRRSGRQACRAQYCRNHGPAFNLGRVNGEQLESAQLCISFGTAGHAREAQGRAPDQWQAHFLDDALGPGRDRGPRLRPVCGQGKVVPRQAPCRGRILLGLSSISPTFLNAPKRSLPPKVGHVPGPTHFLYPRAGGTSSDGWRVSGLKAGSVVAGYAFSHTHLAFPYRFKGTSGTLRFG